MAEIFWKKNRKRAIAVLSITLAATLSMGVFAACGGTSATEDDDEPTSSAVDTQLLKNGNFEFFSERDTKLEDKRNLISTPTSWTFTSGSPSSDTRSGLIKTEPEEWDYITKSTYRIVPEDAKEQILHPSSGTFTPATLTDDIASQARAHWDEMSVYDRLIFYMYYDISSTSDFDLYKDYAYSIDFEDIATLREDVGEDETGAFKLHPLEEEDEPAEDGEETVREGGVLMIHNQRTMDKVVGTAQYYTSSTTITLEAGTAAEVTVWARTDELYHYNGDTKKGDPGVKVSQRAGAYIGIINTVGGTTLDEMQIKNINTNGEWQKFTVYVRANTYASTTFRVKLGLGQGTSSDDRYYNVNGYAFFDDVSVKKIPASEYKDNSSDFDFECDINSLKDNKLVDMDLESFKSGTHVYGLDLYGGDADRFNLKTISFGETEEVINIEKTVSSKVKGDSNDITEVKKFDELTALASSNGYLANILHHDFDEAKYPFDKEAPIIMLLSVSKAAYTAKTETFELAAGEQMFISFFVKTSEIRSGKTGASVTLVDGNNRPSSPTIAAFDSRTIATVDIDKDTKDIYDGWVQCFLFIRNDTEDKQPKLFSLEFNYGPTSIASSSVSDYAQGYAAFANFECGDLSKTQYSYASTGSRAVKVDLTAKKMNTDKFDDAQASSRIEDGLAAPASFDEVLAGSEVLIPGGDPNERPDGIHVGLLNSDYATTYEKLGTPWSNALNTIAGDSSITGLDSDDETAVENLDWWAKIFGDANVVTDDKKTSRYAQQTLVLMNTGSDSASYGLVSANATLSAGGSRKITLRVKVIGDTAAYIYLIDTDETPYNTVLTPSMPKLTYWYDDDGNIVKGDPTDKNFDKKKDIFFTLEENGLYTKKGANDGKYYANLANYDKDEYGNLVTSNGKIAFYAKKLDDEKVEYYAYRSGSEGNYKYEQKVEPLADNIHNDYARYIAPEDMTKYQSMIKVDPTGDKWVEVSFFLRAGSEAKNYRLELWAGDRENTTDGFKANSSIFFDAYNGTGSVSDFTGDRDNWKDWLLEVNELDDDEKLGDDLALYYTFTFYDSVNYLRYDATTDKDGTADKWTNYNQSAYSESPLWLKVDDVAGEVGNPFYSLWIDYSVVEVAVSPDANDSGNNSGSNNNTSNDNKDSNTNIWLVLSSVLLAAVLVFAIVAVIVRRILKNRPKTVKPKKAKRAKNKGPKAPAPEEGEDTPEEAPAAPTDNPYDE